MAEGKIRKIWIISGESSGDIYGAELAIKLKSLVPEVKLEGMGGAGMRRAGVDTFVDSSELGIVGIIEVLKRLSYFIRLLREVTERARRERPDAVVLIDYPGFNIRLAERLHVLGIKVVYYISPQVWAWKKRRIYKIAKNVDKLLCIFPFEPEVYATTDLDVRFVGHPLLEILKPYTEQEARRDDNLVLILPGSRASELKYHVRPFLETAEKLLENRPALHFSMPLPREKTKELAERLIEESQISNKLRSRLEISVGNTREQMTKASAALAASGTVTVEATILNLPVLVSYKMNALTFAIAKRLVKLPSITITNLVTKKTVFEEKLQEEATAEIMAPALESILPGGKRRQEVLDGMAECVKLLGGGTDISRKVAQEVLSTIGNG